jgi:hypothetical protein
MRRLSLSCLSAGQPANETVFPWNECPENCTYIGSKTTSAPARPPIVWGSLMPPINPRPPLLLATHPSSSHSRSLLVLSEFQCPSPQCWVLTELLLFTSQPDFLCQVCNRKDLRCRRWAVHPLMRSLPSPSDAREVTAHTACISWPQTLNLA